MKITNNTRALILDGIRKKGLNQSDLTDHLGLKKSWGTRLFNGTLKNLSDEYVDQIAEFLGISFVEVTSRGAAVSSVAAKISDAMEEDENLSNSLIHLMAYIDNGKTAVHTLPYIPTDEVIALGDELIRAGHEDPNKRGKIGMIAIRRISEALKRIESGQRAPLVETDENIYPISFLGCVAAGSACYMDAMEDTIYTPNRYDEDHFALQVSGSSQDDGSKKTIPDGSTIVVRKMKPGEPTKAGRLYVVSDGNGSVLKMVKGKKLVSLNPKFPEFTPLEDAVIQAEFVEIIS